MLMEIVLSVVLLVVGLAVGAVGAWLVARIQVRHEHDRARMEAAAELAAARSETAVGAERIRNIEGLLEGQTKTLADKDTSITTLGAELTAIKEECSALKTTLGNERATLEEKLGLLKAAEEKLQSVFQALAAQALNANNEAFLNLAKASLEKYQEAAKGDLDKRQQSIGELVKPVKESLEKVDKKIEELEQKREGAYAQVTEQIRLLNLTQDQLRDETSNLVRALRSPSVRGRWGEMQLRRVVEMAGMLPYCEFVEQASVETDDGRLRPDMLIKLAGGKQVVIDAKAPLEAYLDAIQADTEELYRQKMKQHSQQLRAHISKLCEKRYWSQFESTPEFVYLFLPGEIFYFAALQHDSELIEYGNDCHVYLASPTTLLALLKAVAHGWQEEALARNALEIKKVGRELYERICVLGSHMEKLGKALEKSVETYNGAVGSLEANVITSARRLKDLEAAPPDREIPELEPVEIAAREIRKAELLAGVAVAGLPAPPNGESSRPGAPGGA